MKASVLVVVHAGAARLDDGLASLEPYAGHPEVEVILVDNGSPDRCGEVAARRFPWAKVVRSEANLGFAGGVCLGAEAARGEVLLLLNDDAAAGAGWLEAHLAALDRHPEAAATAGRLTSWDGIRHDFVRGAVTFDVHAFQLGQGWPLAEIAPPAAGEPLPFPCGGNMAVRRADWDRVGGFDRELFAYFEDVDLGWRLWAAGRQVVAAPAAVARHRGSVTSAGLGNFGRGVLFERNALRTFFACADAEHRQALGMAVTATFLHRLASFATLNPEAAHLTADPFGPVPPPVSRRERWRRRLAERGPLGAARHLLARLLLGPLAGLPVLEDGYLLMQLRAARGFFSGLEHSEARRRALDAVRVVPDRELLARFPRLVVPTYAGDQEWFASAAFASLLPAGWPLEHRALDQVLHPSVLAR